MKRSLAPLPLAYSSQTEMGLRQRAHREVADRRLDRKSPVRPPIQPRTFTDDPSSTDKVSTSRLNGDSTSWNGNTGFKTRVLILGTGPLADFIMAQLQRGLSRHRYHLVGCLDGTEHGNGNGNGNVIGGLDQLEHMVVRERIQCVIVAMSERRKTLPIDRLLEFKTNGIRVEDGVSFYEKLSGKIELAELKPSCLVFSDGFSWPHKAVKRGLDLLLCTLGLALTAPLFVLLPLLIKLTSPGPVFYRQERAGLNGRPFLMLKFRSMTEHAEDPGNPVWAEENDSRVTGLGRFMRKVRLDELPQMLNVLWGEMSFVGPRPERPEFVKSLREIIPYYPLRLVTKPGITGWAQIMFRYGATVQDTAEKLRYDLYYIKRMSLALDVRIVFGTIWTVMFQSGAR